MLLLLLLLLLFLACLGDLSDDADEDTPSFEAPGLPNPAFLYFLVDSMLRRHLEGHKNRPHHFSISVKLFSAFLKLPLTSSRVRSIPASFSVEEKGG